MAPQFNFQLYICLIAIPVSSILGNHHFCRPNNDDLVVQDDDTWSSNDVNVERFKDFDVNIECSDVKSHKSDSIKLVT